MQKKEDKNNQNKERGEEDAESGDSANTFEEVIQEAHNQINSKERVDTQDLLSSLQELHEVPEGVSEEHIDMLLELIFTNCPKNLNNEKDKETHFQAIQILHTFL